MKSAIGNTFIMNFIIVFTIIFIALFIGSITYTKALRIKNRITDIIEQNGGYSEDLSAEDGEITKFLKEAGYRISTSQTADCEKLNGTNIGELNTTVVYPTANASQYRYCIYKYDTKKGSYYGVKVFMYLDLPIIGDMIEFPVYGETKVMGILGS